MVSFCLFSLPFFIFFNDKQISLVPKSSKFSPGDTTQMFLHYLLTDSPKHDAVFVPFDLTQTWVQRES